MRLFGLCCLCIPEHELFLQLRLVRRPGAVYGLQYMPGRHESDLDLANAARIFVCCDWRNDEICALGIQRTEVPKQLDIETIGIELAFDGIHPIPVVPDDEINTARGINAPAICGRSKSL